VVRPGEWERLAETLAADVEYPVNDVPRLVVLPPRRRGEIALRADALDELSLTVTSVALAQHLGSVGEVAARIGERIGLRSDLVQAIWRGGRTAGG
jgi:hypothetical protein